MVRDVKHLFAPERALQLQKRTKLQISDDSAGDSMY